VADKPDLDELNAMNADVVAQFRANGGNVSGPFEAATVVLLTATGAKTGTRRMTPLVSFTVEGKMLIIGSYGGADVDPAWVHNLRANPQAHVEVGTEAFDVIARELPREERDSVFAQVVDVAPGFGEYQANTNRVIPLFELNRA
jgi:deazaflavin-dependent oxidoreductase (nitroreductase family)